MRVNLIEGQCNITREEDDPKLYSESLLLHKVKTELINQGHDVIKKRMWKDGHLYGDDTLQYIRTRNPQATPFIMIYDGDYAIRAMIDDYNNGELTLLVDRS